MSGRYAIRLRRYLIAGLVVILPLFISLYVLFFLFRFIDGIFGSVINYYIRRELGFAIPGIGIILGLMVVLTTGFIASRFLGRTLFPAIEGWFLKFPLVKQIYPPARQIVNFFLAKEKPAFRKVVLVEYPSKGLWSVGFITNDGFAEAKEKTHEDLLHIFFASTPSPLTGFLVLVPKKNVVFLDIPIEDGLKLIVSGGILGPGDKKDV
ncbi:MAG: DUF502 domain-containing protein [Candidatus Omnitrophota bacterium]